MDGPRNTDVLKDLHRDLGRRYQVHGPKITQIWRSLSEAQRTKVLKAGAADGVVLKHSNDISLEGAYKMIPEWNLRDITAPKSDFLLQMLHHRATTSLLDQYHDGFNGRPGDYELIREMMLTKNLRNVKTYTDCWTMFVSDDMYGDSYELFKDKEKSLQAFMPAIKIGACIPQATGELILTRQLYLLQSLTIIIEDILEEGSTTRTQKKLPKKSADVASAALSKLSIQPTPSKLDLPDLHNSALDQKALLADVLNLICTEPVVFEHVVNTWFFSSLELVQDEKGRSLPAHTDRYISAATLEAVHNAVRGAAIWNYMCRLLELFKCCSIKSQQTLILQEISNLCHLEYTRAQTVFRRHVATGTGRKWFKRISNAQDNGNARVGIKGDPESLIRKDPQLHYMLRLCQPETTATKAVHWIRELDEFQKSHPLDRQSLQEREVDALFDLAVIIGFIHSLHPTISIPSFNRKKGQLFVSRSAELEAELNRLKLEIDLTGFAVPIANLLEPGMTEGALKALDQFIVEKTGTKMGFLYQDLVEDCVARLEEQLKTKSEQQAKQQAKASAEFVPLPTEDSQPQEVRVQQRRQKEKTRPTHSTIYEITSQEQASISEESDKATTEPQTFKVKPSTVRVFATLFSRAESRGSITWVDFEAAMADLRFSVMPKFGSVYTFYPPENVAVQRSVTFHRPHKSNIEGYLLLIYGRRLKKVYGWAEQTFTAT
ncbi:hypothetical protein SLS62_007533 [Diatrype stigma]|uniref:Ipa protein n=1 Tax=Diatrype stigma TaxID=117547 RepID=A0AAN9YQ84_9PEZI